MPRYEEELKLDAVRQVTDKGFKRQDVAKRLGISALTLSDWIKKINDPKTHNDQRAEITKLKAEQKRTTEERNVLK